MVEAGLMPGDTTVVLRNAPAKLVDIVVAIVDNEFTAKYHKADKHGESILSEFQAKHQRDRS